MFLNKLSNQVAANGRLLIKTLSSLQTDLEKSTKRLEETEASRVALEHERDALQKDLNDSRAAHNAQVCMNASIEIGEIPPHVDLCLQVFLGSVAGI